MKRWFKLHFEGIFTFLVTASILSGCGGCVYIMSESGKPPPGAVLTTFIEKRESFQLNGKDCGEYYICHYWAIDGKKVATNLSDCTERFVKCDDESTVKIEVDNGKYGWK